MTTDERLSRTLTMWSLVRKAHQQKEANSPDIFSARRDLLLRYREAAHRYLLGAVRDADVADELFQDFAVRFMRGDFHRADPCRGRFRDFLRTSLSHMVSNHRDRCQAHERRKTQLTTQPPGAVPPDPDQDYIALWREATLNTAWEALARLELQQGVPYYTALQARCKLPRATSAKLAAMIGEKWPSLEAITDSAVRKWLERGRRKFALMLVEEVRSSLSDPSPAELLDELAVLGLLTFCKNAITGIAH